MTGYRTTATVSDRGTLVLDNVPFGPGEQLDVFLNRHGSSDDSCTDRDNGDRAPTTTTNEANEATGDSLDAWYQRLQDLGAARFAPGEVDEFQRTLDEADALAKEHVRRQMGLP